jgi:hypothetical protein
MTRTVALSTEQMRLTPVPVMLVHMQVRVFVPSAFTIASMCSPGGQWQCGDRIWFARPVTPSAVCGQFQLRPNDAHSGA